MMCKRGNMDTIGVFYYYWSIVFTVFYFFKLFNSVLGNICFKNVVIKINIIFKWKVILCNWSLFVYLIIGMVFQAIQSDIIVNIQYLKVLLVDFFFQ